MSGVSTEELKQRCRDARAVLNEAESALRERVKSDSHWKVGDRYAIAERRGDVLVEVVGLAVELHDYTGKYEASVQPMIAKVLKDGKTLHQNSRTMYSFEVKKAKKVEPAQTA